MGGFNLVALTFQRAHLPAGAWNFSPKVYAAGLTTACMSGCSLPPTQPAPRALREEGCCKENRTWV